MNAATRSILSAVKLGQECRARFMGSGSEIRCRFAIGTPEFCAWQAGYANDLSAWLKLFNEASRRAATSKSRRLRNADEVLISRGEQRPERGIFIAYKGGGKVKVISRRFGKTEILPREWVEKMEAVK